MDRLEIIQALTAIWDRDLELARRFLKTLGLKLLDDPEVIQNTCKHLAESGNVEAQHVLAKLHWVGLLGERDRGLAVAWCQRAAGTGYPPALVMLSEMYATGAPGLSRDDEKAKAILERAAKAGSASAMAFLGTIFLEGLRVQRDREKAFTYLRNAAELGDAIAQCQLGNELVESNLAIEMAEGVKWLNASANLGFPSAHHALAYLYEVGGAGLQKNLESSRRHRTLANLLERE